MSKRETPTLPPPPMDSYALEIETRADRLDNIIMRLQEQRDEFRNMVKRMRGETV